jgi:hypothetical protein
MAEIAEMKEQLPKLLMLKVKMESLLKVVGEKLDLSLWPLDFEVY